MFRTNAILASKRATQTSWQRTFQAQGMNSARRATELALILINQGELVVDGITAVELELWLDLSVGAALGPPAATPG
jgi:hypothetical protein